MSAIERKTPESSAKTRWPIEDQTAPYVPTEEEIAAGCREIQQSWPPQEERSRRLHDVQASRVVLPRSEFVRSIEGVANTDKNW